MGWTIKQPYPLLAGPYAYNGDLWVGYDDEDMVKRKVQYADDNNLGGINIWALNFDDFRGTCTGREYPLIEAVKDELYAYIANYVLFILYIANLVFSII